MSKIVEQELESMRRKLDDLSRKRTNEIVPGEITEIEEKVKEWRRA